MTSYKIYNPLLGLNIPYYNSVLPATPDAKNNLVETAPIEPKPLLVGPGFIGNSVGGQAVGHNLYNPFSDYLGLAQMVERQHMADNFEKLVMENCIVPGEDIRNELNRLFVQDETSSNCSSGSRRERVNSWTSCSDSGNSSDSSSQSPVPNNVNNNNNALPEYKPSISQYSGHQNQTKIHSNHYSQSVQMSNNLSKNTASNGNISPPVTSSNNLLLKPASSNNAVAVSQLQLNLPKPIAVCQSQHQQHVGHSLLSQPTSGSLVSTSSSPSARLPPSVQLARKLTAKSMCVFCKNNGEMESVYSSHVLKNEEGAIVCPILRAYTCPICGVSGDNAHTIKYCPQGNNESTIKALKQTRNSTARRSNTSTVSGSLTSAGAQASILRGSVASCVTTPSSLNGLPLGPGASHAHSINSHLQQQNQANAGHFSGTSSPFGHQAASVVTGANSQQVAAAAALLNAAHLYSSSKKF